jgi:hypothetical protein
MDTQTLIQEEIIRAVLNARKEGQPIKETIKSLAKEFNLTEFMVRGIIEYSAMYGLERGHGPKQTGSSWKPLDYAKAIERLDRKVYQLQAEIVKLNNRLTREFDGWGNRRNISAVVVKEREEGEEPSPPERKSPGNEEINRLRAEIDKARDRIDRKEERGNPGLLFVDLKRVGE